MLFEKIILELLSDTSIALLAAREAMKCLISMLQFLQHYFLTKKETTRPLSYLFPHGQEVKNI